MPHMLAGLRTDPPVSEPIAAGTNPAATAAPDPLDDPPLKWSRFHGLRAGGHGKSNEGPPIANSCVDSLPMNTAPAVRMRDAVHQDPRVRSGRQAGIVDDVLQGVGHAVKHAAPLPARDLVIGAARVVERNLRREAQERVELRVVTFDVLDQAAGVLERRELPAAQQFGRLGQTQECERAHGAPFAPTRYT
jgi:hypothetical protein